MHFFFDLLELHLMLRKQCFTCDSLFRDTREPDLRERWTVVVKMIRRCRRSERRCTLPDDIFRSLTQRLFILSVCYVIRHKIQCESEHEIRCQKKSPFDKAIGLFLFKIHAQTNIFNIFLNTYVNILNKRVATDMVFKKLQLQPSSYNVSIYTNPSINMTRDQ